MKLVFLFVLSFAWAGIGHAAPEPPAGAPPPADVPQGTAEPPTPAPALDEGAPAPSPPVQRFEPAEIGEPNPRVVEPGTEPRAAGPEPTSRDSRAPLTMDEIPVSSTGSHVVLNIFGDTGLQVDSTTRRPAFVLGPLDLLLLGQYANLVAISEIGLETKDGQVGIDLERLFVRWRSERFTVDAGRTHTELGYWNNAFHHGRWLQMSVDRPRAVRFEDDGGLLPIHWVGVTGRYHLLTGARQLDVIGAIGNGRGNIVDDIHTADDTNAFKSLLLKIEAKGFGASDLRIGVSGLYDRIAPAPASIRPALPDQTIQEIIGNAYLAYRGSELTMIAEIFDTFHSAGTLRRTTVDAFVLAGYRVGAVIPYVMGEVRAGRVEDDPFFFPDPTQPSDLVGRFKEGTAGIRWDLNTWSAIKVEYQVTLIERDGSRVQRGIIDWTFGL